MPRPVSILLRLLLALVFLIGGIGLFRYLMATQPEPRQFPATRTVATVEALELKPDSYEVILPSQGIIQPRTETQLTAEVSGRVSSISPSFLSGSAFEEGELLVQLDDRDYRTQLERAEASLIRAETALMQAQADSDKAKEDLKRLRLDDNPSDLALKIPQLREAEASLKAAKADMAEAELNVERSRILAPYDGRVLTKQTDVGQFVNPGTVLGNIYSSETFEVRLPLRTDQLQFLNMARIGTENAPVVSLESEGGGELRWPAGVVRTEAAVDARTRQLFLIAAVENQSPERPQLPIGAYVEAEIQGETLDDIFVIPRSAVQGGQLALRITEDKTVEEVPLDVVFRGDPDSLVVSTLGVLKPGDRISLTPLPFARTGDPIVVKGEEPARTGRPPGDGRPIAAGLNRPGGEGGGPPKGPPADGEKKPGQRPPQT